MRPYLLEALLTMSLLRVFLDSLKEREDLFYDRGNMGRATLGFNRRPFHAHSQFTPSSTITADIASVLRRCVFDESNAASSASQGRGLRVASEQKFRVLKKVLL